MKDNKPTIKVNISILPFNEAKFMQTEPNAPVVRKEAPKQIVPEYEAPKTTQPSNFETQFDGDVFYSVPTTSG